MNKNSRARGAVVEQVVPATGTKDPVEAPIPNGLELKPLTTRELEVLQLLAEGASNSEISIRLMISPKTTKNHLTAIYRKLGTTNRTKAVILAVTMGLITIN